jgi:hypothetical protein
MHRRPLAISPPSHRDLRDLQKKTRAAEKQAKGNDKRNCNVQCLVYSVLPAAPIS